MGGSTFFNWGPYISEIYGPWDLNISKYMDRREQKRGGGKIRHDRT